MGNIYFASDLEVRTMEALKEANDCADIINDLKRIRWAIPFGMDEQARALDREMRQKYPGIEYMLQVTSCFPSQPTRYYGACAASSLEKSNLEQDYWGILCDTAIKKEIKRSIEDCGDHIG